MKSLHLTNAWHAASGGIATHYRSLLAEAERTGRQMVMVVPGEKDAVEQGRSTAIHTVAARQSPLNPAYRTILPNRWPGVHSRVRQIILDAQPDLIEICDKYSLHYIPGLIRIGAFKGLKKRPILIGHSCERMEDNLRVYLSKSRLGKAFASLYMQCVYYGFFDHHIANSEHVAQELRAASKGHSIQRGIWVRPPGVDLSCFNPGNQDSEERARIAALAGGNLDSRLVLYAGRLAPEKNLALLIDSFAALLEQGSKDYRLIVAGDGMDRSALEAEALRRFPGRAVFLGHLNSREALASLCANCDVFVHTNPAEPFGIAPLEAMASGLPLVGPNSGGILTYANEGNAWLANPDAYSFANAIRKSFDPEQRRSRIQAALATAARFHAPHTASQFLEMYEQFMTNGIALKPDYVLPHGSLLTSDI